MLRSFFFYPIFFLFEYFLPSFYPLPPPFLGYLYLSVCMGERTTNYSARKLSKIFTDISYQLVFNLQIVAGIAEEIKKGGERGQEYPPLPIMWRVIGAHFNEG